MNPAQQLPRRRMQAPRRRGSVYVIVLVAAGVVTFAGMASLSIAQARKKQQSGLGNGTAARALARAALDLGSVAAANSAAWRTNVNAAGGVVMPKTSFGGGTIQVDATAESGRTLTDGLDVAVILQATTTMGAATQYASWRLEPVITPIDALSCGLVAGSNLQFSVATVRGDATLAANAPVTSTSSLVFAPVRSSGVITGSEYLRGTTASVATIAMPGGSMSGYKSLGTEIDKGNLTDNVTLENVLLGVGVNPFGTPDPNGVYWIDGNNKDLVVRRCRIVGTLIFVSTRSVEIKEGVLMQPGLKGWPTLITTCDTKFSGTPADLLETGTPNVNFNTTRLPYANVSDTDTTDAYATGLEGIVYVGGALRVSGVNHVRGCVIATGIVSVSGSLNIWRSNIPTLAPPLFIQSAAFRVKGDTFARVVP